MPVKFYPDNNAIDLLEQIITKEDGSPLYGEIEIYRQLFYSCQESIYDWHVWYDLKIPFHSHESNPLNKSEGQIDFLVLCKEGLIVIEVKGGKIYYSNRRFYSDVNLKAPLPQNPIDQVNGYKITLVEKITSFDGRIFITSCIAFPHSTFSLQSDLIDTSIIWAKNKFDIFDKKNGHPNIAEFLLKIFKTQKRKMLDHGRKFNNLGKEQISNLLRYLNPISQPANNSMYPTILEWLDVQNLNLFNCLKSNRKLMIEGGPGSGKTTFALAYIDERREKKGLFICWNKLLKASIKKRLFYRGLQNCDVLGFAMVSPGQLDIYKEKKYDYLVIDEGQDLFEKGIDVFVDNVLENGKGLKYGNILLLYDIDQSYSNKSSNIRDYEYILRDDFAHFRLSENKRSAQFPVIKNFAIDIINGNINSLFQFTEKDCIQDGVCVLSFDSTKKVLHYLRNNISKKLKNPNDESNGSNSVLLVQSSIYNTSDKYDGLEIDLIDLSNSEELTENNSGIVDNVFRFTTPLKYKGLESKYVYFICNDITSYNYYELYVGVTRAIYQVELLVVKS